MDVTWDIVDTGPRGSGKTVLLLPGGLGSARTFREVMAEPSLATTRLVAVTLPGHAGSQPLADFQTATYAEAVSELARTLDVDVVVGFSMGAMVAAEMVTSGGFKGPVVLLASSFCAADEPAFLHVLIRLSSVLGTLPAKLMRTGGAAMMKKVRASAERQAALRADMSRTDTAAVRKIVQAYGTWLRAGEDRAARLCDTGQPMWVVHSEKGDGGLTDAERSVLAAHAQVRVVTLPGHMLMVPVEAPGAVADAIQEALAA